MGKETGKLRLIEEDIDKRFFSSDRFSKDRTSTISFLLTAYEMIRRGPDLFRIKETDWDEYNKQISAPLQSRTLERLIYFVFQRCPPKQKWDLSNYYEEYFEKLEDFLGEPGFMAHAAVYCLFEFACKMYWRGFFGLSIKKKKITFRANNEGYLTNMAFELLRVNPSRESKTSVAIKMKSVPTSGKFRARVCNTINHWFSKTGFLPPGFKIPRTILEEIVDLEVNKLSVLKKIPFNWDFGKYCMQDFWEFWTYIDIKSGAVLRGLDPYAPGILRYPLYFVQSKDDWINEISQGSRLRKSIVQDILGDLIFDFRLPNLGVRLRPFIPMDDTYLALSPLLVYLNLVENNFLDLQAKINRAHYDRLKNEKESLSILEIVGLLKKRTGIYQQRNIILSKNGKQLTDLDLVVLDSSSSTLILLELKWLMRPDTVFDVLKKDEDIDKGIEQAKLADKYVRKDQKVFLKRYFPESQISSVRRIVPIVVVRDNIGSTIKIERALPVCDYDIFLMYLADTELRLDTICGKIAKGEWLPKKGRDYKVNYRPLPLFDYFIFVPSLELLKKNN